MQSRINNCDACGAALPEDTPWFPDDGWSLDWANFGGYSQFMDVLDEPNRPTWTMCHNCVVKFLETFPALAVDIPIGAHPSRTEAPCCPWSYRLSWEDGDASGTLYLPDGNNWKQAS